MAPQLLVCQHVGARRLDELIAWQLAHAFKLEVYRLIRTHRAVERDLRFADQIVCTNRTTP